MSSLQNEHVKSIPKPFPACKRVGCNGKVEKQVSGASAASFTFSLLRCNQCGATYPPTEFIATPSKDSEEFGRILDTSNRLL
jgi:hypothetical protein